MLTPQNSSFSDLVCAAVNSIVNLDGMRVAFGDRESDIELERAIALAVWSEVELPLVRHIAERQSMREYEARTAQTGGAK